MAFTSWLTSPFRFAPIPVSVLTVIIYAVIFGAVLVTDQTPGIPTKQNGLSLQQAYKDLHEITARPHPYISHANDDVREFLLSRIKPIVDSRDYIYLSDDVTSNATWANERGAFYFEGTNILVKIDGTDSPAINSNGVLFSAHYDSVSTAPGATDDGMGVVTLLQMLEYLAAPKRRPRRTAVFFFNNGEEDGLNGAHVLFEHPWANLTTTFINLEGAAAGGRPILFRSSLATARAFNHKSVPHPHGNALSADAFARGVIRSATDYSVYAKGIPGEKSGMGGVDLAFYKNRAFYHTPFDSIPGMGRDEGRKALWAMMETTQGVGLQLLNGADAEDTSAGVYFDLLGRKMVTVSLRGLFITHIAFLIIGPLVVLGLLAWVLILTKDTYAHSHPVAPEDATLWHRFKLVLATVMGWGRFWLTLLITIGVNIALVAGYVNINRYIVYSKEYVVLATFLTATFLSYTLSLQLFHKLWPSPPTSQKFAILLETYFLSWVFLVIGTVGVDRFQLGGVYLFTVWNLSAWLAVTIALVEAVLRAKWTAKHGGKPDLDIVDEEPQADTSPEHHFVRGIVYQPPVQHADSQETHDETEPVETEPTEITPLMQQQRRRSTGGREYIVGVDGEPLRVLAHKKEAAHEEYGWWIFQMLALIPLPTMLLFQIMVLIAHALRNTLADGSSPVTVYGSMAALSVLIFVNVAPFAHRIDRTLYLSVLVVFIVTLIYSWTAFPFTQDAPLKLFFQQSIEVDSSATPLPLAVNLNTASGPVNQAALTPPIIRAETLLTGIPGYIDKKIVRELPSSWGQNVSCDTDTVARPGLLTCKWDSGLLLPSPGQSTPLVPLPPAQDTQTWITFNSERVNASAGRISIKGTNTRGCTLYFDGPITSYTVSGGGRLQPGYEVPSSGTQKIQMWSRDWEKTFDVEFAWAGANPEFKMTGRAACEWAEYASGTAGSPRAARSAQIPALEEVLHFLPLWATPTKFNVGLVEAWTKFSI